MGKDIYGQFQKYNPKELASKAGGKMDGWTEAQANHRAICTTVRYDKRMGIQMEKNGHFQTTGIEQK